MAKYIYKARDKTGQLVEGVVQADSSREVVAALNNKDLIAVSVEEIKAVADKKKKVREKVIRKGIKPKDIAVFCRQMATMINAGVSVIEAIEDIAQTTLNLRFKRILSRVGNDIKTGSALSESLNRHPNIFNQLFVSMMRAGEESGNLDVVLMDLAKYLESMVALKRKIKSASMYPIFILSFMGLVTAGLVLFLVPKFKNLFLSLGADLPLPTQIVMMCSDLAIRNIHWLVLIVGGALFFLYSIYHTRLGRLKIDTVVLAIPIIGLIVSKVILTRFFQTLATLIKSGVDIVASLEIASKVVNNLFAEQVINNIRFRIMEGSTLSDEMSKYFFFPKISVRMTSIGEKSGKMDEMFVKIAEYYNDEIDATVEGLSSLIEPVLIVALGLIIGVFVVSMYLPVFKMAMALVGQG